MENKKRISVMSIIIAILLVAILGALIWVGISMMNSDKEESESKTSTSKTETNKNKKEEKEDDEEEEDVLANLDLDELVYDAEYDYNTGIAGFTYTLYDYSTKQNQGPYTYKANSTKIEGVDLKTSKFPYIDIDSTYAKKVNEEIEELYNEYLDNFKERIIKIRDTESEQDVELREELRYQGDIIKVDDNIVNYEAYLNGNILSVIIVEGPFENIGLKYTVYNIDVSTGKKVTDEDIINMSNYSDSKKISNELKQKVEDVLVELYEGENIDEETLEANVNTTINEYIFTDSEEMNIHGAYFNAENNLCLIFETYTGWGIESQKYIYEFK